MNHIGLPFTAKVQSKFFLEHLLTAKVDTSSWLEKLNAVPANDSLPDNLLLKNLAIKVSDSRSYSPPTPSTVN